jgi:flagellar M-ring protein FliF
VKKTKLPQGIIRRMSVSVLVDQALRWQSIGKGNAAHLEKVIEPPTADQLKIIRDVVAASVGVNPGRGDVLTVETLPFQATLKAEPPKPELPAIPNGKQGLPKLPLSMPVLIGVGAGILLLIVGGAIFLLRGQKKARAKALAMEQQLAAAQTQKRALAAEPVGDEPGTSKLDELGEKHKKLMEASADFKLPPMLTSKTEVLTKQLSEEAQKDPMALAQIIRTWLNEERKN